MAVEIRDSGSPEKRKSLICWFFEDARKSEQAELADFRRSLGSFGLTYLRYIAGWSSGSSLGS